ncbi:hypothetical protein RB628_38615 [Streptomyces sp. ADMS]|uniref:WD40 repeat domain-containing protein n=1 Tax=Streptomyces sp. ADMS TaxID=3071415 RepID=UPI00296F334E|nr:hypothetical protein [Streptomyces sp. ADMS]MDW4911072.1 hypothetical protein [Streptomyces sp. ADMS]
MQSADVDRQLADPRFLVHADPGEVLQLLDEASGPAVRLTSTVYRGSLHLHQSASPAVRRQVLALAAAQFGDRDLAQRLAKVTVDGAAEGAGGWVPVWTTGALTDQRFRQCLTGHTDEVCAVATTVVDGRPVAVTGSADTTVRVWDLATGQPAGPPMEGHAYEVTAVATAVVDDRPVAVTGDEDTLRVWDLTTGSPIGDPLTGHTDEVAALATAMLDGRAVAVVGSHDDTVRVWDLATGQILAPTLEGISLPRVLATAVVDDRPVALTVTADHSETVQVWDLGMGQTFGPPLEGHTSSVYAVATAVIDGRPVAVTGGYSPDPTLRVWDLATGQPTGPPLAPEADTDYIDAVAMAVVEGRPVAVAVTRFNEGTSMQMVDLGTGRTVGRPMHTRDYAAGINGNCAMTCVATTVVDGRQVAVTGCADGTVQVWDLTAGQPAGPPMEGHAYEVTAVATAVVDDRPVAVTSTWSTDDDGTVNMWDLATGQPVGEPLYPHYSPVHGLATAVVDGRPVAVSLGHDPKAVVWDLTTGQPATQPSKDSIWCTDVVATTVVNGRPVAVTGDRNGLQMWDLGTGEAAEPFANCHVVSLATAVVGDRPVAVTGSADQTVRVWDLTTRHKVGEPLTGHTSSVHAVVTAVVEGRPVAATGSGHGVRVWDLTTRRQVGPELLLPGSVNALAASDGRIVVCFDRDITVLTHLNH